MYRKSQSLIEELYEKKLIKLVEITGLLLLKVKPRTVSKKTIKTTVVINNHGSVEAQDVFFKVANL